MKYRWSARNLLVGLGGGALFWGAAAHQFFAAGPGVVAPLVVVGACAVVAGLLLTRVARFRFARAVAHTRGSFEWTPGDIAEWAMRSQTFPLQSSGLVTLSDCWSGAFRETWVTTLRSRVDSRPGNPVEEVTFDENPVVALGMRVDRWFYAAIGSARFQVIGLPCAAWVPRVQIMPVGKARAAYGIRGGVSVDFESADFNAVWHVSGDDARKVHDMVHPRAMERLLRPDARDVPVIVEGGAIWTWRARVASAADLARIVGVLYDFAMGVPSHLDSDGRGVVVPRRSESMSADIDRVNAARPPKRPIDSRG